MTFYEFLKTTNKDAWKQSFLYYYLTKKDGLLWLKHEVDNGMISEEEYLKEILLINYYERINKLDIVIFTKDGKIIKDEIIRIIH